MSWPGGPPYIRPDIREETHYGGRPMRCFAERPAHVDAMLRQTAARWDDAEAVTSSSGVDALQGPGNATCGGHTGPAVVVAPALRCARHRGPARSWP